MGKGFNNIGGHDSQRNVDTHGRNFSVKNSVLLYCIEKQIRFRLYQRSRTPRPATKIMLKNAWQVEHGKLSISERSIAQGNLFKIDLRIPGIRQHAVLQDQRRITKIQASSELNTEQNLSLPTWVRQENSTGSARNFPNTLHKLGKIARKRIQYSSRNAEPLVRTRWIMATTKRKHVTG